MKVQANATKEIPSTADLIVHSYKPVIWITANITVCVSVFYNCAVIENQLTSGQIDQTEFNSIVVKIIISCNLLLGEIYIMLYHVSHFQLNFLD